MARLLVDISERAQHGDPAEWLGRLSADQRALVDKLMPQLVDPHSVFARLRVERIEADRLGRDFDPHRLPEVSAAPAQLLVYLREFAGADARVCGIFKGARLRQTLERAHGLRVQPPNSWDSMPVSPRCGLPLGSRCPAPPPAGVARPCFSGRKFA